MSEKEWKRYAVGYIDFFNNVLEVKIGEGVTWKEGLENSFPGLSEYLPDDLEEAKSEAFNQDWQFDITEI